MQFCLIFLTSTAFAVLASSAGSLSGIALRHHQSEIMTENSHSKNLAIRKRRKLADEMGTVEKRI
jgi:hypothetical protein